ncbi:hypothetical protein EDD16DRAFT_1559282 [Pisolithus croceorrhizus]|nr:hypothetical protein EDD16DRAFT_1559282 [Pisolithus croceorrhizus]
MSSFMHFQGHDPLPTFDRLFEDAFTARFMPTSAVGHEGNDIECYFRLRYSAYVTADASEEVLEVIYGMDLHESGGTNTVTATFSLLGLTSPLRYRGAAWQFPANATGLPCTSAPYWRKVK